MMEFISEMSFDSILIGAGLFLGSFIVMLILWSALLKTLFSVFGKSKFFFIPKTLKELFFSVSFIFVLLSGALAILFIDRNLLGGEALKILQILVIFAIANIVARVVLTGIDIHHKRAKDRSGIFRSIGLLKSTVGIILYLFAIILSINVLSAEVGTVVMVTGFFIIVLLFAAGFDQIKSIIAGFQLGDYYVDVGNLIKIDGYTGFVETVHGRSTLLTTMEGKMVVIPNSHFFDRQFEIDTGEVSDMYLFVEVEGKNSKKIKERISAISSKIAIDLNDIPHEYKPKIFYLGINEKKHAFNITFKVTPESDVRKIIDRFSLELSEEFGDKLVNLKPRN
ncbi:mechanosensitive ion channel family protein [Candidatus Micrarchaeota archaeon]|nr:mechanosensitive ion channel family protein [Candidatus Micrarchaeota archaeon]